MRSNDWELKNSYENETLIAPVEETNYTFENGEFKLHIEPLSWNVYVFEA